MYTIQLPVPIDTKFVLKSDLRTFQMNMMLVDIYHTQLPYLCVPFGLVFFFFLLRLDYFQMKVIYP